jgi:hypothetical protein
LFCLIALVLGWVVYSKSSPSSPVMASSPATMSASLTPKIEGSKIYFVPIGDFPTEQLQPLVEFYRQKYKLGIAVLNSIPVDPVTRDASLSNWWRRTWLPAFEVVSRSTPVTRAQF